MRSGLGANRGRASRRRPATLGNRFRAMVDSSRQIPFRAPEEGNAVPVLAACFGGRPPQQIGLLVRDLDASLRAYVDLVGIRPWSCYTYDPTNLRELTYR